MGLQVEPLPTCLHAYESLEWNRLLKKQTQKSGPDPMIGLINQDIQLQMFELGEKFRSNKPFPHLALDNFFRPDFVKSLLDSFPEFDANRARNELGEIGRKATFEPIRELGPAYQLLDDLLKSEEFLKFMSAVTMIPDLIFDPEYIGGGTHENLEGQELDPHVDFNYHPLKKWHRRVNLLLYLNTEWEAGWGGALELHSNPWEPDTDQVQLFTPVLNRCVIFETSERSWHGFKRIRWPEQKRHLSRKSISVYFYSKERPDKEIFPEHGTFYVQRPLPEHLKAGYTLNDEDVLELKDLLTKRDQWVQFLYERELRFSAELGEKSAQLQQQTELIEEFYRAFIRRDKSIFSIPRSLNEAPSKEGCLQAGSIEYGPPRPCPLCGDQSGNSRRILGSLDSTRKVGPRKYELILCSGCELVFQSPLPSRDVFKDLYIDSTQFVDASEYTGERAELANAFYASRIDALLQRMRAKGKPIRVLEVGSGLSWMSRATKGKNAKSVTVAQDITAEAAQICKWVDHYLVGELDSVLPEIQKYGRYELISMTHVIEHLPDPIAILRTCNSLLSPNGIVFITSPHRPENWNESGSLSLWEKWSYNHVPAHLQYFNVRSIGRCAERSGLEVIFYDASAEGGQALEAWLSKAK